MDLRLRDHADRRAGWHLKEVAPAKRIAFYLGVTPRRIQQVISGSPKGLIQDLFRWLEKLSDVDAFAIIAGAREHVCRVKLYRMDDQELSAFQHDTCHSETEAQGPLDVAQSILRRHPDNVDALRTVAELAPRQSRKLDALAACAVERLRRMGS